MSNRIFALHCLAVFNLACAQPLYEVMSHHIEFFVAQGTSASALFAICFLVSFAIPSLIFLSSLLATPFGETFIRWTRATLLGIVVLLGLVPIFDAMMGAALAAAIIAALCAIGLAGAYERSAGLRAFATFLSPGAVVFPALFLLGSPALHLLSSELEQPAAGPGAGARHPTFLIIFDEFPTVAIMTSEGRIDKDLYPNFSRLASQAHWFRNATSVSPHTERAVPTILTGTLPEVGKAPLLGEHPQNLFTLLAASHDVRAFETLTSLCPESVCASANSQPAFSRVSSELQTMLPDLAIIWAHVLSPRQYRDTLPSLAGRWTGFGEPTSNEADDVLDWRQLFKQRVRNRARRLEVFGEFLDSIDESKTALRFVHVLLPHLPYQFDSHGQTYVDRTVMPGWNQDEDRWTHDPILVGQAYQRFLRQVQFTDLLLGKFLDRLELLEVYEDALIVVTADHGVNFTPGVGRRAMTADTLATLLPVPLLIKEPGQREGTVVDANVESIDILPTMADILELQLPEDLPGTSALANARAERDRKRALGLREWTSFSPNLVPSMLEAARRKEALFGNRGGSLDLDDHGPLLGVVGRPITEFQVDRRMSSPAMNWQVTIDDEIKLDAIPADQADRAYFVRGRIAGAIDQDTLPVLVIAANDAVAAVTRAFARGEKLEFTALLKGGSLRPGRNDLQIYLVTQEESLSFLPLPFERLALRLTQRPKDPAVPVIHLPDGRVIEQFTSSLKGGVRPLTLESTALRIAGWIAAGSEAVPVEALLVYDGESLLARHREFAYRPDVARAVGSAYHHHSFNFTVGATEPSGVRIFAVLGDGRATEVKIRGPIISSVPPI